MGLSVSICMWTKKKEGKRVERNSNNKKKVCVCVCEREKGGVNRKSLLRATG